LTEKLLLFGGAIRLARSENAGLRVRSDWKAGGREFGISV
jgi:peptide subunit release factor RF-3